MNHEMLFEFLDVCFLLFFSFYPAPAFLPEIIRHPERKFTLLKIRDKNYIPRFKLFSDLIQSVIRNCSIGKKR